MSKHAGNRTGREAKKRRARHERRMRLADERLAVAALSEGLRAMEDAVISPRSGKTARAAELAQLFRSGRITIVPPVPGVWPEEPLTDSELAMRYALQSMGVPRERLGLNAGSESGLREYYGWPERERASGLEDDLPRDWSATYLPPKEPG